jgi:hypothetical protein
MIDNEYYAQVLSGLYPRRRPTLMDRIRAFLRG